MVFKKPAYRLSRRSGGVSLSMKRDELRQELLSFCEFGEPTRKVTREIAGQQIDYYVNEFWTSRQRAANPLQEVSYRACFKPQLPRFFIERLSEEGELVYDPFMGRGTTLLEAALMGREVMGCDVNPLAPILCAPRLSPATVEEVKARLATIPTSAVIPKEDEELLVFYHRETLSHLLALRSYLLESSSPLDSVDQWIRMVATNRLTGHSPGFFSVYTLPPNQAASLRAQEKINQKRNQTPPQRDVAAIIKKKSKSLLKTISDGDLARLRKASKNARFITSSATDTHEIADESVMLVVTSPPFLDVIDYQGDNWLRCWFNGFDAAQVKVWGYRKPEDWQAAMEMVLKELYRVLKKGGHIAFEVGEVRKGTILLEELVIPAGMAVGLEVEFVLVNEQEFTKTAQCWGVDNLGKGTNTNRVVLFSKR